MSSLQPDFGDGHYDGVAAVALANDVDDLVRDLFNGGSVWSQIFRRLK